MWPSLVRGLRLNCERDNAVARPKGTKYIKTPEKMWELFLAYKKDAKSRPRLQHDFAGKFAEPVRREKEIPLTMEGFENFVADIPGMPWSLDQYFSNQEDRYGDYVGICSRIRRAIRQDQIEGGMAGIYNPSITQRLNGLVEKTENKVTVEQPLFSDDDDES